MSVWPDRKPDYIVHHPPELPGLLERLDAEWDKEGKNRYRHWQFYSW